MVHLPLMSAPTQRRRRQWQSALAFALLALQASAGWAFVVSITSGSKRLFLQVGSGSGGASYINGGNPNSGGTRNTVSVNVPAGNLGAGDIGMTSDSTVSASPYDGFNFCPGAGSKVYVGGYYRTNGSANASLTVTSPTSLSSGGDTIPFNSISWVSSGADGSYLPITNGRFTGGTQSLYSASRNTWFEACLTFSYDNDVVPPAGTYTGTVTYSLTAP